MMNKKGTLVLRDVMFMILIVSSIFVLAGLYVSEIALNYDNEVMADEWAISDTNTIANSTFYTTSEDLAKTGQSLGQNKTGIWKLISSATGALDGIGNALFLVLTAPNTIGNLVSGTLIQANVPEAVALIIKWLIVTLFWAIIIFTIASAFLRGGKI